MAAPGARMRLTVEVLPLVEENAHGPYRDQALAAFKGRKFALPVLSEDTFEKVWAQIEQRYKTNYLTPQQAAAFTINKLQDAYDCDLDLGDTVNDIFEGESDPAKRMIKVVPSFVNREFSVPASSNLHPGYVQKRLREINAEHANKRRRIEHHAQDELDPRRDQPVPTTESELSGEESASKAGVNGIITNGLLRRSQSGGSVVFMQGAQTGRAEFAPSIKEESPELGEPTVPASTGKAARRQTSRPLSPALLSSAHAGFELPALGEVGDTIDEDMGGMMQQEQNGHEESLVNGSPQPTPEEQQITTRVMDERRDVYDVPSSPEFMSNAGSVKKSKKTYARSPRSAKSVQKEVDLLNSSRSPKASRKTAQTPLLQKNRALQPLQDDDIESTPQDEVLAQSRNSKGKETSGDLTDVFLENSNATLHNGFISPEKPKQTKAKAGKLRTPSKKFLQPNAAAQNNGPANQTLDTGGLVSKNPATDIQARLDKIRELNQQRASSPFNVSSATKGKQPANRKVPFNGGQNGDVLVGRAVEQTSPALQPRDRSSSSAQTDNRRLSSQAAAPRRAPKQSPIPLPANVRNPEASTPSGSFKKPLPKVAKDARNVGNAGESSAVSIDRRRTSSSSGSIQHPTSAQKPRADDVDSDDEDEDVPPEAPSSAAEAVIPTSSASTPDLPKKRGRPRIHPLPPLDPHTPRRGRGRPRKTPSETPAKLKTSGRPRGRPPKDSSADPPSEKKQVVKKPTKKSKLAEAAAREISPPEENDDEAIVVSSGVSSDESEPEPTPLTQEIEQASQRPGVPQIEAEESVASLAAANQAISAEEEQEQSTTINNADTAEDLEESIQADLQANSTPIEREEPSRIANLPWSSPKWGFKNVPRPVNGSTEANTNAARATANNVEDASEPESDAEADDQTGLKSRSASVARSDRSSPEVSRQPAKYLSHTPPPVASESDSEEEPASPFKDTTPKPISEKEDSDSDSDSTSDDDTSQDEGADDDTETPDVTDAPTLKPDPSIATDQIQSSPPISNIPASTPLVPSTSQPSRSQSIHRTPIPAPTTLSQPIRQTPIPVPGSQSQAPRSSQSVSGQAAARRPAARYAGFPGLREQLVGAQTKPTSTQKKAYDPRMLNLGKLAAKGKGRGAPQIGIGAGADDDSSEEESSSSSSSDSD